MRVRGVGRFLVPAAFVVALALGAVVLEGLGAALWGEIKLGNDDLASQWDKSGNRVGAWPRVVDAGWPNRCDYAWKTEMRV